MRSREALVRTLRSTSILPAMLLANSMATADPHYQPAASREAAAAISAKCPGCQVAQLNYSGQPLTDMNFAGADLSGADFSNARLQGVSFIGANLSNANFTGATLEDSPNTQAPTSFSLANLSNANFSSASMGAANFQYSALSCTNFSKASMTGALFGAALYGLSSTCAPVFTGATVNCNIAQFGSQLNLSGATVPGNCPSAPAGEAAGADGGASPAWQCSGAVPEGFSNWIYVNPSGGSDSNTCSSASSACASLAGGLSKCPSGASCGVLAYYNVYTISSTLNIATSQGLIGGCLATGSQPDYYSVIQAGAGAMAGQPIVSAAGAANAVLSGFHVEAASASGSASASSVGVMVSNKSSLSLKDVNIIAAQGAAGAAGSAGTPGSSGSAANGQSAGSNAACNTANGGSGGYGMNDNPTVSWNTSPDCSDSFCTAPSGSSCSGSNGASGAAGGQHGNGVCYDFVSYQCDDGKGYGGNTGSAGTCGSVGQPDNDVIGTYGSNGWMPAVSGNGGNGGNGAGGGGGGGGGYCTAENLPWYVTSHPGQVGGGGGAGGCGGVGGTGGTQGGASFALIINDATVAMSGVTITGGLGGSGGAGGPGAIGGAPGGGAAGTTKSGGYSDGGPGANGMPGGSGGGGAGGNGGPAYGIAYVDGGTRTGTAPVFYTGYSGDTGSPTTTPATSGNSCTPALAPVGKPGRVANENTFSTN